MTYQVRTLDYSKAFNRGSDSRLHGASMLANPYIIGSDPFKYWKLGWLDVDKHWGRLVNERWGYQPLPAVRDYGE